MAFVPMLGVGTAVMTLVGRRVGEGRPRLAIRTTWTAFVLAAIYMLAFSALYLTVPDILLLPYAAMADAEDFARVQDMAVILLRYVAVYAFFDAIIIVFSSAIRGAGDTRFGLWLTLVAAWLVMVLPTWILVRNGLLTLHTGWIACTGFIVLLALGFLWRFLDGKWQSMTVLEPDLLPTTEPPVPEPTPKPSPMT